MMVESIRICLVMFCSIAIIGCATGGKEGFIEEGAILLMDNQVIDTFKGNTQKGNGWAVYNRPDGGRIIRLDSGETMLRKWWINHLGQWCLTSSKGKRHCGPRVYKLGDIHKEFAGGTTYTYKILPGNPLKISP